MAYVITIIAAIAFLSLVLAEEEYTIVDHGDHTHRYRVIPNENIYGSPLDGIICSTDPMTGWFRDGTCKTGPNDSGTHVVCAQMTEEVHGQRSLHPQIVGFPRIAAGRQVVPVRFALDSSVARQ